MGVEGAEAAGMGTFSSCLTEKEHYGSNVIVMRYFPLCGDTKVEENRRVQEIKKNK